MKNKRIKIGKRVVPIVMLSAAITGCSSAGLSSGTLAAETKEIQTEVKQETDSLNTDAPIELQPRSIATDEVENLQYYLYIPEHPTEQMPLIVYLHGASGKGENLNLLTSAEDLPQFLQSGDMGDVRAYILMPQLPSSQKGWSTISSSLYALIQETVSEFSIDETHISLAGFSMGGAGVWEIAAAYPELFFRIAPLAGSARGVLQQVPVLKEIPVWAFVGSADTVIKPNSSQEMIYTLKKEGGEAEITVFEGAEHISVPPLVWLNKNINLMDWLIGSTK